MKTLNILFLSVLCLLLTACRVSRQVAKTTETVSKQITENKISYRDTVLYTPKTVTSLKLPFSDLKKCPESLFNQDLNTLKKEVKPQIYTQKNGNATAKIKIEHDTITVTAECDSIALAAKIRSEFNNQYSDSNQTTDSNFQEKEIINWWKIAGYIILAFIAGFVTKSLIKISI